MGCFGGGGDSQSTQSSTKSLINNLYTDEQTSALKNILDSSSGLVSTLGGGLDKMLTDAFGGNLTDASQSFLRTGKAENANLFNDFATTASESLAGKGMLNSGASNKVMDNLFTGEAKANESLFNTVLNNQQDALYKSLATALGLTSVTGSLATKPIGQEGTKTSSSTTSTDTSGSDTNDAIKMGTELAIAAAPYVIAAFCLPKDTEIETEDGTVKVQDIKAGDIVKGGRVIAVSSLYAGEGHKFYKHTFANGEVIASKGHPFNQSVIDVEDSGITDSITYDILTESGHYYINGVDTASTIAQGVKNG